MLEKIGNWLLSFLIKILKGIGMSNTKVSTDQIDGLSGLGGYSYKMAILGDSLTQQHNLYGVSWAQLMEDKFRQAGGSVGVFNCSVSGHTFYRARNTPEFSGKTAVEKVIEYQPNVVLILLGFNDLANNPASDNRTLSQVKSDAALVVADLRAALPDATIIWGAVAPYDLNQSLTGLKNKSVYPTKMVLPTTGVYANCYSEYMLEQPVSSETLTCMSNWENFYVTQQGLFDNTFLVNYWRIIRLGLGAIGGLHLTEMGSNFFAGYVMKGLTAYDSVVFPAITDQFTPFSDPDLVFGAILQQIGTSWVTISPFPEGFKEVFDQYDMEMLPDLWFYPWKAKYTITSLVNGGVGGRHFVATISGAKPFEPVYHSINGASFTATGDTTNESGCASIVADSKVVNAFFTIGNNTICHKVGSCIFPVRTFSYSYTADSGVTVNLNSSDVTGILQKANGGTGTSSPTLSSGTNIEITGTWPNQTIATTGVQQTLVSGTNIKTINGTSLLGSGDMTISGTGVSLDAQNNWTKTQRITGIQLPTSGEGLELVFDTVGRTSYVSSYNRSGGAGLGLNLLCANLNITTLAGSALDIATTKVATFNQTPLFPTATAGDSSTKGATTAFVTNGLSSKQNTLVSGSNIKTVNGNSLVGSGNVDVSNATTVNGYKTCGGSVTATGSDGQYTVTFPFSFSSSNSYGVIGVSTEGHYVCVTGATANTVTLRTVNLSTGVGESKALRWVASGT